MAKEIERKFLIRDDSWKQAEGTLLRQGYLNRDKGRTIRVRLAGSKGFLTVKGETFGATREEFEYEIPPEDAVILLDEICEKPLIEKRRYRVEYGSVTFEIDEFLGENEGLILAEVELEDESQQVPQPPWLGEEVTHDPRYFNSNLVAHPYRKWTKG